MGKLYTVSKKKKRLRGGAYCGSDHELLIAKFRLKLKKVEKTTRPFKYDLNQIPYDYTVEVTMKGLDLTDRMSEEVCTEVCNLRRLLSKTSSIKKKCAKWQNDCLRRPYK